MMTTDKINLVFGSDFHFGVRQLDQWQMGEAFCKTLFPLLEELPTHVLFLNGDFFDDLVIFDNQMFDPIYETIIQLFHMCEKHQTTLRLLQGTWGHDRNQCKRFEVFYKNNGFTFDFKFVDGIQLEEITVGDRSLRFFYVQDNLPYKSSQEIVEIIHEKMREKDWDYVDYGCMHGFFDFTFPQNVSQDNQIVFNVDQFPFVRKLIDVGHVHQYRVKDNVISNGSFDRINHGEEEPKGCIVVHDYPEHYTARFVENIHSTVFDTLVFDDDMSTEALRDKVTCHVESLDKTRQIFLRFFTSTTEQYEVLRSWMKTTYPDIKVSRKKKTDKDAKPSVMINSALIAERKKRIAPTRATIATFVRHHIPESHVLSVEDIQTYLDQEV